MILCDIDIEKAIVRGDISISPMPAPGSKAWQPASVDLTLAPGLLAQVRKPRYARVDLRDRSMWQPVSRQFIRPHEFLLASTAEAIALPLHLAAIAAGKSSIARSGLQVEAAGFIDPGFRGTITLELTNMTEYTINLPPGIAICQVVFHALTEPSARWYGHKSLNSHYYGQQGPTPPAPED